VDASLLVLLLLRLLRLLLLLLLRRRPTSATIDSGGRIRSIHYQRSSSHHPLRSQRHHRARPRGGHGTFGGRAVRAVTHDLQHHLGLVDRELVVVAAGVAPAAAPLLGDARGHRYRDPEAHHAHHALGE
ncbi:unnamed protein product, partial [Ectocarpus fasciculatus]